MNNGTADVHPSCTSSQILYQMPLYKPCQKFSNANEVETGQVLVEEDLSLRRKPIRLFT